MIRQRCIRPGTKVGESGVPVFNTSVLQVVTDQMLQTEYSKNDQNDFRHIYFLACTNILTYLASSQAKLLLLFRQLRGIGAVG